MLWRTPNDRLAFNDYCRAGEHFLEYVTAEEDISILSLAKEKPFYAVLLMRTVPDSQLSYRNKISKAIAVDISQAAIDYSVEKANGNPLVVDILTELQELNDGILDATQEELKKINERAYGIRMELERRDFKYAYVYTAIAVFGASTYRATSGLFDLPAVKNAEVSWAALYNAASGLRGMYIYDMHRTLGVEAAPVALSEILLKRLGDGENANLNLNLNLNLSKP